MSHSLKEGGIWIGGVTGGGLVIFCKIEEEDYTKLLAGQEALAWNVLRVSPNAPSAYMPKLLGTEEPWVLRGSEYCSFFRIDEIHSRRLEDSVKESLSDIKTANAAEAKKILQS